MSHIISKIFILICIVVIVLVLFKLRKEILDYFEEQEEDQYILSLVQEVKKIDPRVEEVVKRLKFYKGRKSYTINKTNVYICKNDQHDVLYEKNQLMLVLIHEIAHTLCTSVGHTDEFNAILADLLLKAERHGLYDPNKKHVENYCP